QIDDIADRRRGFLESIDIDARFLCSCAGLIGELAGIAHLRADVFGRMGELVGGLRADLGGALRSIASPAERVGALANRGKRRSRGLGPAGNGTRRSLELADHSAE